MEGGEDRRGGLLGPKMGGGGGEGAEGFAGLLPVLVKALLHKPNTILKSLKSHHIESHHIESHHSKLKSLKLPAPHLHFFHCPQKP